MCLYEEQAGILGTPNFRWRSTSGTRKGGSNGWLGPYPRILRLFEVSLAWLGTIGGSWEIMVRLPHPSLPYLRKTSSSGVKRCKLLLRTSNKLWFWYQSSNARFFFALWVRDKCIKDGSMGCPMQKGRSIAQPSFVESEEDEFSVWAGIDGHSVSSEKVAPLPTQASLVFQTYQKALKFLLEQRELGVDQ